MGCNGCRIQGVGPVQGRFLMMILLNDTSRGPTGSYLNMLKKHIVGFGFV